MEAMLCITLRLFFFYFLERNVSEKGMQCCIQTVNIVKKL